MKKLEGVTVAMITPLNAKGNIEENVLRELVNFLIEKRVDCLYPLGTTGEMYRLSTSERKQVAEIVVEEADNRVPVFIHVGAMRMNDILSLAKHAHSIGADGIGAVTPSYFNVNNREMEEYYIKIAESVPENFPVYLYNIPQCSGNDLKPGVIERIKARSSNVIGIKYSYPDILRTKEYLNINNGSFSVLHGTDKLFYSLLAMGCEGTVSGVACVYPEPYVSIYEAFKNNNRAKALKMQKLANKFNEVLKGGTNMAYFKEALKMRGIDAGFMRRPQLELTETEKNKLKKELRPLHEAIENI